MTPLEELQAAHDHLLALRTQASPGPWTGGEWNDAPGWDHTQVVSSGDMGDVTDYIDTLDVQLIVTLHRTIDAQLHLLREAIDYHKSYVPEWQGVSLTEGELILARAINGEAS